VVNAPCGRSCIILLLQGSRVTDATNPRIVNRIQWRQHKSESVWGQTAHVQREASEINLACPSTFFGSTATIIRFGQHLRISTKSIRFCPKAQLTETVQNEEDKKLEPTQNTLPHTLQCYACCHRQIIGKSF